MTARNRVGFVMAAVLGAIIGAASMAPMGSLVVDGDPGCRSCGYWTLTLIGIRLRDPYPVWLPALGGVLGGALTVSIVTLALQVRGSNRAVKRRRVGGSSAMR